MSRDVEVRFTGDTTELEASIERAISLAERFREVWGDEPRPDGIERLEVKPGDTVVLRCDDCLDDREIVHIKEYAEELFDTKVVVLTGGLRMDTVLGTEN